MLMLMLDSVGGEWLSELESSVQDRDDVYKKSNVAVVSDASKTATDDSKENVRGRLTKLVSLPPLKNNPATRQAFKPVKIIFGAAPSPS